MAARGGGGITARALAPRGLARERALARGRFELASERAREVEEAKWRAEPMFTSRDLEDELVPVGKRAATEARAIVRQLDKAKPWVKRGRSKLPPLAQQKLPGYGRGDVQ